MWTSGVSWREVLARDESHWHKLSRVSERWYGKNWLKRKQNFVCQIPLIVIRSNSLSLVSMMYAKVVCSVGSYIDEFCHHSAQNNLNETTQQLVAWYVGGLKEIIQDKLEMNLVWSLPNAFNFTIRWRFNLCLLLGFQIIDTLFLNIALSH